MAYLTGFALLVAVNEATREGLAAAGAPEPAALAGGFALALGVYTGLLWLTHTGTDNLRYARELVDPRRFVAFLKASS